MAVSGSMRRAAGLIGLLAMLGVGAAARADNGAQDRILECKVIPGSGYTVLVHSSSKARCVFRTPDGSERYGATLGVGLGLDLRWTKTRTVNFAVIGVSGQARPGAHALAGKYMGGSAAVAIGLGVGASALIGGGGNGFTLQPLGIEHSEGIGVAAGLGYLFLDPA